MERKELFSEKEAKNIAKEFNDVLKKLAEAFSKLAEEGIAHESWPCPKEGRLVVQLFKEEVEEEF